LTFDLPLFGAILAPRTGFSTLNARAGAFSQPNLGVFPKTLIGDVTTTATDPAATCLDPDTGASGDFVCIQPGVPIFGSNPGGAPFDIFGIVPDLKTALVHNYNISIQHELFPKNVLTLSYVGTQ